MQALLLMEHTLMASTVSPFRFEEFAKDIYREISNAHRQPFLLPALYGGEFSEELYEALFVLEAPSVSFTEARWKQCNTAEDAIRNHRRIFLDWAYSGKQAHLFNLFMTSSTDFYRRFYVTDVWKDAAFRERIGDSKYREYWRSKLAVELQHVRTRRVIFVGREAALAGRPLIKNRLIHEIPFPSHRISDEQFKRYVDILAQELGIRPGPRPLWRLRRGDVGGSSRPTTRHGGAMLVARSRPPTRQALGTHFGARSSLPLHLSRPPKCWLPTRTRRRARQGFSPNQLRGASLQSPTRCTTHVAPSISRPPAEPRRRGPSSCRARTRPTCGPGHSGRGLSRRSTQFPTGPQIGCATLT